MARSSRLLVDFAKPIHGFGAALAADTADYVSMKHYRKCAILIDVLNGSTVTGSVITLKQATAVAGTGEKALAFTKMWANTDCAATDTLVETTVSSNTFTTATTNGKILQYVIDVDASMLDVANGFDCLRLGSVASINTLTFTVAYFLYVPRYQASPLASAIID